MGFLKIGPQKNIKGNPRYWYFFAIGLLWRKGLPKFQETPVWFRIESWLNRGFSWFNDVMSEMSKKGWNMAISWDIQIYSCLQEEDDMRNLFLGCPMRFSKVMKVFTGRFFFCWSLGTRVMVPEIKRTEPGITQKDTKSLQRRKS